MIKEVVTFIVPAYNAEKTLERTIESILHQTDGRYKLILVNDGSVDGTDKICQCYLSQNREKICYISQENRGLGGARNAGLKIVETPYVAFLDSDDWLKPQYVEKLIFHLDRHKGKDIEMIMTLPQIFHEASRVVCDWYDKELFEDIFSQEGEIVNPQEKAALYRLEVNQCRKILKMDFVKKIKFSFRENVKWEDVYPHFYLLSKCTSCMGIGEIGFYYRIGSSEQITASRGADRLDLLIVFEDLLNYIEKEDRTDLYFPVMRVLIRFSIWCIRMTDIDHRKLLVNKVHGLFKKFSFSYYKKFVQEIGKNCTKADARQYFLFMWAIRCRIFNFIFYDYLWQEMCEKIIKKILGAGERVA